MERQIRSRRGERMTHEAPNQSYGVESTDQETLDRKAKKKLQNRVAQRLYRQRMKSRMQELQAKVQCHEQMAQGPGLDPRATIYHTVDPVTSSNCGPSGGNRVPQWMPPAQERGQHAVNPQQSYPGTTTHPQQISRVGINSSYDGDNDDDGGVRVNDWSNNRPRDRGVHSRTSLNESHSDSTASTTSSFEELLQAQAQAQAQTQTQTQTQASTQTRVQNQEDARRQSVAAQGGYRIRVVEPVPNATSRTPAQPGFAPPQGLHHTLPNTSSATLVNANNFDNVNVDGNVWDMEMSMMDAFDFPPLDDVALSTHDFNKTVLLPRPLASSSDGEEPIAQTSDTSTQNLLSVRDDDDSAVPSIDPSSQELQSWVGRSSSIPTMDASLEDRLQYVIERATAIGFADIESAMQTYYTTSFSESSSLQSSQRVSRNRRLPRVLAEICDASEDWSLWEQRGVREEVLKGAEDVLIEERSTFRRDSGSHESCTNTSSTSDVKRVLQEKLPNLWTLLSTLSAENRVLRPNDRSRAVFCAIATLCCSSKVQEADLTSWLQQCSNEARKPLNVVNP